MSFIPGTMYVTLRATHSKSTLLAEPLASSSVPQRSAFELETSLAELIIIFATDFASWATETFIDLGASKLHPLSQRCHHEMFFNLRISLSIVNSFESCNFRKISLCLLLIALTSKTWTSSSCVRWEGSGSDSLRRRLEDV
jgi:hypothetical protein